MARDGAVVSLRHLGVWIIVSLVIWAVLLWVALFVIDAVRDGL